MYPERLLSNSLSTPVLVKKTPIQNEFHSIGFFVHQLLNPIIHVQVFEDIFHFELTLRVELLRHESIHLELLESVLLSLQEFPSNHIEECDRLLLENFAEHNNQIQHQLQLSFLLLPQTFHQL